MRRQGSERVAESRAWARRFRPTTGFHGGVWRRLAASDLFSDPWLPTVSRTPSSSCHEDGSEDPGAGFLVMVVGFLAIQPVCEGTRARAC